MTRIDLDVKGAEAKAKVKGSLTGGMVGVRIFINYDSAWDGLSKTLVCRSSLDSVRNDEVRTVVNVGTEATVAHEVMIAGRKLYLGVEGRNAEGTIVYPTIWADCGKIQPGANADADATVSATPEVWEQLLTQMGSLDGLDTDNKENLVSAINEAMTKGNGLPGKDGRAIASVTGNEDGSWTFTYDDGSVETVSNEAYMAMTEQMERLAMDVAEKEQLAPEFANTVAECTDPSKLYVLPDGYIYAYMTRSQGATTNYIPLSVDANGQPYNGGTGYKTGYRVRSTGEEVAGENVCCTGFIPVKLGDVVRFKNIDFPASGETNQGNFSVFAADGSFAKIEAVAAANLAADCREIDSNNIVTIYTANLRGADGSVDCRSENLAYLRFSVKSLTSSSVITINEYESQTYELAWCNTGHAFVPADYEGRIIALEQAISGDLPVYGIVDESNNILMSGTLMPGTYTVKYQHEDGTTTEIGTFTME